MLPQKRGSSFCIVTLVALIVLALYALSGCSSQGATPTVEVSKSTEDETPVEGTILVSGAWALYPMMVKWGEEYQALHPDVRIDISAGGAGKGMADALSDLVDIGMISRGIRQEEIDQGAYFVPVTKDTVLAVIHENNPLLAEGLLEKGLTRQDFVDLWMAGEPLTWGQLIGSQSTDAVQVYTRSDSCGAAEVWAAYLGGAQEDLQGIAVYGDPGLAEAVRQDRLGIGYNNLNYAFDLQTGLPVAGVRVVPIDVNENGQIDPEEVLDTKEQVITAVRNGIYPSPPARELYLVTKDKFTGLTRDFVMWILTDGQQYVDETGYIQLTPDQIQAAQAKLGE